VGVILSVVLAAAVTFLIAMPILLASRKRDLAAESAADARLAASVAQTSANKGKDSAVLSGLAASVGSGDVATKTIEKVVFACDAGMGSSAMGASVLRNKFKKAGVEADVSNAAIANLTGDEDLVITQNELTERARQKSPNAVHVSVDNFMNSPKYDEVVELVKNQKNGAAE
jgi:PTS system mannitol-specific IIC component